MTSSSFALRANLGAARLGELTLPHGKVPTPCFMPVGTRGSVRGVDPLELHDAGASMVLANTYHLWERPGHERIKRLGGLHGFMGWQGPILTDSGGYQVFSMADKVKLTEQGARFRSPLDGSLRALDPEKAVEIQEALGVDVAMALDACIPWPAERDAVARSTERTTRWLKRCMAARTQPERTALFGIVQGGMYGDLRAAHAQELRELPLEGLAIGGLSVGEPQDVMLGMLDATLPELPADRPRYLMGVGHPHDLVEAVLRGVDLFDCVLPTRAGRHGTAYTWSGRRHLNASYYADCTDVLDPELPQSPANRFSLAYLRHLFHCGEQLGPRLLTVHNLMFYQDLMRRLREAIGSGDAAALERLRLAAHRASKPAPRP